MVRLHCWIPLRETNIVSSEAGGITQHIGAYQITVNNNQKLTFLDTPGHEAFSNYEI